MAREKTRGPRKAPQPATARANVGRVPLVVFSTLALAFAAGWFYRTHRRGVAIGVPPGPPNVLLVSVDTLRADYLGAYGAKRPTPALDRLAEGGVVFDRALSHVPITLPSHASMLTGTLPIRHGVRDNGSFRLEAAHRTLAERFRSAGYRAAAFVGSFALDSRFGLDRGFEHYDDYYGDTSDFNDFAISERPAETVLAPAIEWLESIQEGPWFAFVHLYDPHAPYAPPPPFRDRHRDDLYAGEVAYVDASLGDFWGRLRKSGGLANTLVIVTADHGEGLGEHGEKTHGMFAYESTLHVPLILHWEGVLPEGVRVRSRARLIDLAPTLAELTGIAPDDDDQGRSLVEWIRNQGSTEDRDSYFEAMAFNLNRNWAPLTGLYRDRFKYIALPIPELYDLQADPGETRNLAEASQGVARQMEAALLRHVEEHSTEESREIRTHSVDAETEARLRALGYVVAPSASPKEKTYTADDDPKRLVVLSDMLDEGIARHLAGRSEEAVRIFNEILERRPTFTNAYVNLAYVLRETGRVKEAIAVLERALGAGLKTRTMMGRLGLYLQESGRLEESVGILELAVEEDPGYAEAYNYLATSYARLGRHADALRALEKLLALDGSYASAYNNLGSVYLEAGDNQRAEAQFRRALDLDPRLAAAWNGLGVARVQTGRREEAIEAWKRAVELDPRQFDTLYNLGTLLTQLNRFADAVPYLEQFVSTAPRDRYGADVPKVQRLVVELRRRL